MQQAKDELNEAAAKLSALHNEQATKLIELGEKVAAHEYQLTARVSPKKPTTPFDFKSK